ncbi:hypothetical protein BGX23_012481 [Mortierella sp. AD031]|nr:hypothetical protein BGX23_012481 [Mortierella sp. AD031]
MTEDPAPTTATSQVPVGLLTCQHTPYLRQFNTTVLSCSKKPNKQKLYEVQLQDTILFPEGGGQPCDYGTINESIEVRNVQRVGTSHVHHTTAPVEEGIEARLEVDWKRRFDHMQQHSGQHLVSAIFEQPEYGCDTLAWGMNATRCHVELSKAPTPEQVQEERPATLPKDYVGPNGVFRVIEIMEDLDVVAAEQDPLNHDSNGEKKRGLVRLDYNPCCGTHVKSLKDLQCIKLLHQEKIRGNNCRLFFVVGQRALNLLQETYQVTKDLAPVLSAPGGPETYVDTIVKNQKQARESVKQVKNLLKEIATYQVRDWVVELKEKNPITTLEDGKSTSAPYIVKYHRDDVDMDFLGVVTALLKDSDLIQGQRIFILSAGEKKEGGPMIIIGQNDELVKKLATEIAKLIDIKGGGKGRWQGKAKSWQGLDSAWAAAEALVHAESA